MAPEGTQTYRNRIVLVFDFDETLAPDSYNALLTHLGFEPETFRRERLRPLVDAGWDDTLAKFHLLIAESRRRDDFRVTRDDFVQTAATLELFPGVPEMFGRVRTFARELIPDVAVEFYLLTGGMLEIPRASGIADEFEMMWGGELLFDEAGELDFVKRAVRDPDKRRYLLKLVKGLEIDDPQRTQDVQQQVDEREWYVPFSQVVYVGDGSSDMPAYAMFNDRSGLALGVVEADHIRNWEGYSGMRDGRRLENLAPVDYREGSELMNSLLLAVDSICKRMLIRRKSIRE